MRTPWTAKKIERRWEHEVIANREPPPIEHRTANVVGILRFDRGGQLTERSEGVPAFHYKTRKRKHERPVKAE